MKSLRNVVFWQMGAWLVCCVIAFVTFGSNSALSAFWGGFVCAVPSFLVIALLCFVKEKAGPAGIFIFEFAKVSLVILGFLSVALFFKDLDWSVFIMTAGLVLLSHIFALASRV